MEKFRSITEDAFGRQRVSEPYTLFDAHHRYKLSDKFYSVLANGGTVTHIPSESTANLQTTSTLGSSVIYESTTVQPYQPGKSLLIMLSFAMGKATGVTYRAGYFGTLNGIYFQVQNGVASIVKRNNGQETIVTQDQWNMNKLIGVLDVTKTQIFWMDIEWLGVGRVRCGFNIGGVQIPCHAFFHANIETGVYMTTAILPIRYELFGGAGSMKQICATVMSEGGYQIKTNVMSNLYTKTTTGALTFPMMSLRLKSTNPDAVVLLNGIEILSGSNKGASWKIVKNATLTGANWVAHTQSQLVEIDISATAVAFPSTSTVIDEGLMNNNQVSAFDVSDYNQQLTRRGGVPDTYTVVFTTYGDSNSDNRVLLKWNEF